MTKIPNMTLYRLKFEFCHLVIICYLGFVIWYFIFFVLLICLGFRI